MRIELSGAWTIASLWGYLADPPIWSLEFLAENSAGALQRKEACGR